MDNKVSVAFNLNAPIQSGPGSSYQTVFGHQVHFSHCYPLVSCDISRSDYDSIISDPEKSSFVRVAMVLDEGSIKFLKGTSWH